jgi:hypothetical protein
MPSGAVSLSVSSTLGSASGTERPSAVLLYREILSGGAINGRLGGNLQQLRLDENAA